ncbi:hypothetical protein [Tolypothrix sp. VBCCA 56010]
MCKVRRSLTFLSGRSPLLILGIRTSIGSGAELVDCYLSDRTF